MNEIDLGQRIVELTGENRVALHPAKSPHG